MGNILHPASLLFFFQFSFICCCLCSQSGRPARSFYTWEYTYVCGLWFGSGCIGVVTGILREFVTAGSGDFGPWCFLCVFRLDCFFFSCSPSVFSPVPAGWLSLALGVKLLLSFAERFSSGLV